MGNNCCVRSKNPQELEYGLGFDTGYTTSTIHPKAELINMQRSSISMKEAQKIIAIQMFDPSCHALPVALHHCMSKTCLGLKSSIKEVFQISQNYSQGISKSFFDAKFLLQEYGTLEIQSKGSRCWDPSQLSKQYQKEFMDLKKQSILSPYSSEIDNLVCIIRRKKQSFAFSFKLNSINQDTQKQEFILHTLFPYVKEGENSLQSLNSFKSTQFKGFDCGELAFESIFELYEYLDTLFEEEEDYSISGIETKLSTQKSNEATNESQDKQDNFIFIQLIAFLQISRMSNKSEFLPYLDESQMQSSESYIDLLNTYQFEDSDDDDESKDENKQTFLNSLDKENQRCSYLSLKQNVSRFSHKSPYKLNDILQTSKKQNQILNCLSPIKQANNYQPK